MWKPKKLTKRQLELLHVIEEFFSKNGVPPTIVELKQKMNVKSDQSIYQLLEKLENADVIVREPGKRRSIRLSGKKSKSTGIGSDNVLSPTGAIPFSFSLDPTQKKIFNKLHEIDPQLAIIFKGGMYTLAQKEHHPDWIPPVANAIRHIFSILTRSDESSADQKKNTGVQKISKAFDPFGGISSIEDSVWAHWNKLNRDFVLFAHYNEGYYKKEDEFIEKIEELYELLLQYILINQHEIYERIDEIAKKGPDKITKEEVAKILSRNTATYTYFFDELGFEWFDFLKKNNFLKPTRQVGQYIRDIASEIPEEIVTFIETYNDNYKIDDRSRSIRQYFLQAACEMPAVSAVKIVGILAKQKWVQDVQASYDFLIYEARKLLEKLIEENEKEASILLTGKLLDVQKTSKDKSKLREVEGFADNHQYAEIVECIKKIPAEYSPEFVGILLSKLKSAIDISDDKGLYTQIWRPSIEHSEMHRDDVVDILIDGVISMLKTYFAYCRGANVDIPNEIKNLFKYEHVIFTRIKLFLYRKFSDVCKSEIQWAIIDNFDAYAVEKEYDELLEQEFDKIDKVFKEKYLELVEAGPKDKKKKDDEKYLRYWKINKLILIKEFLNEKWQKIYVDLLNGDDEEKYKPMYSGIMTSWAGPTSPQEATKLSAMSLDKLIEYLIQWTPKKGFAEHSRLGLGRELVEVIKGASQIYSKNALLFNDERLHVVYLYQYFFGLREALRNGGQIDWQPVLELMKVIVDKAKANSLPVFEPEEDDWNLDWSNCFQYMADLLENGLNSSKNEIPESLQNDVWEIIKYLCEDKDPDLDHEKKYGGENSDYYHLSINTTRGEAFHALFNYIFWYDRHVKKKGVSRITDEVKEVLEAHLDTIREPGFTIRSVYGRFFPWLYIYDKIWTEGIIDELFPLNDVERRYAAWETYLINAVYPEIFEKLRPQYEKAIDELRKSGLQKNKRPVDIFERLVEHLMIAYFYEIIEYDDPLLKKLDEVANREQKGWAVNFGGRVYITSDKAVREKEPSKERLKLFWENRLKESRSVEELKEFGWWLRVDFFDNKWMLENLLETLDQTKGIIDPDYRTMETLENLSEKHPLLVAQCLLKIVKAQYQDRFLRLTRDKSILSIVQKLYRNEDDEVKKIIAQVSDHMLRLGNNDFREYL
ncbi:MAG: hypothetical protein RBS56_04020 [Candidatus Gracilibacteria bacterium]|nr:hypothetical protein [Candidatus Gracilibacteria bacterium]